MTIIIPAWLAITFGSIFVILSLLQIYINRQQRIIKDLEAEKMHVFMDTIDEFIIKFIDATKDME